MTTDAEQLEEHIESIHRAINGKLEKEKIAHELQRYLNEFNVPLGEAKRSIIRKYGGGFRPGDSTGADKTLAELDVGEPNVNVLCRVLSISSKEITARGEQKTIFYGLVGDTTGVAAFTAWKDFSIQKGDVIRIQNAYVTEWQEKPQLNLGDRAMIKRESEELLDPQSIPRVSEKIKVRDLTGSMSGIEITARIASVEQRTITANNEKKDILSGVLEDETGKAQFTAWHVFDLAEGDVVRIGSAYVRSWKGIPSVNFDERSTVEKLEAGAMPAAAQETHERIPLDELAKKGGALDASIAGFVVEIRSGSGIIFRCPECKRAIQKNMCTTHGKVEGVPDIRIKAVIDDGRGTVNAIFGRELTEALLGKTLEELMARAKEAMDTGIVVQEIKNVLLLQPVEVRGNVMSDSYGMMIIGTHLSIAERDIKAEVEALADALEELRSGDAAETDVV